MSESVCCSLTFSVVLSITDDDSDDAASELTLFEWLLFVYVRGML